MACILATVPARESSEQVKKDIESIGGRSREGAKSGGWGAGGNA